MNKAEMTKALAIAKGTADLTGEDLAPFDGYGLYGFGTVYVTLNQVARLIRWQAQCMDGSWNGDEISQIADIGRSKFQIIG